MLLTMDIAAKLLSKNTALGITKSLLRGRKLYKYLVRFPLFRPALATLQASDGTYRACYHVCQCKVKSTLRYILEGSYVAARNRHTSRIISESRAHAYNYLVRCPNIPSVLYPVVRWKSHKSCSASEYSKHAKTTKTATRESM